MSTMHYTEDHEWVRTETDGTATIGITDHAQDALGDIVFIEMPEVGKAFAKGDAVCVVESVKAASDVYAPVDGEIVAFNDELEGSPQLLNESPYTAWIFKLKPAAGAGTTGLLDAAAYRAAVEADTH